MVSSNCWPSSKHVFPATGDILLSAIPSLSIHRLFSVPSSLRQMRHWCTLHRHRSVLLITIRSLAIKAHHPLSTIHLLTILPPPHCTIRPSANAGAHHISTQVSAAVHCPPVSPSTTIPLLHHPPSHSSTIHHPPTCPLSITVCPLAIHH